MTRTASKTHTEGEAHWIEWLTGLVSAAIVLAMIGWIGVEAMRNDAQHPDLAIANLTVEQSGGNHRVVFDVTNAAMATAAGVTVRGEILQGDTVIESSEVTFDYVPAESQSSGALLFRADPSAGQLRVVPMGYTEP